MKPPPGCQGVELVKVLLVEPDSADAQTLQRALAEVQGAMAVRHGLFEVARVDRLTPALDRLARESFGTVLLDLELPDCDGLEAITRVRAAAVDVPVIVLTRRDDDGTALEAIQRGAQDFLAKHDLDGRLLRRTIRHAIERKRAEVQLRRHVRQLETAHTRIEQQAKELKARADQLDRINRELDDFTYIASHDLKEPLRGISAFCEILLEDYHDRLDDDGQHRLATLVRLCDRLENLVSDLLTFCRVGGVRPADTHVELGAVLSDVLETLRPAIDQRGASVRVVGRLPVVTGDATLIGMALGNLISNGMKFNRNNRPHVQIGCLPTCPPTLYVRDDGIGIDQKHHDDVFAIFRRLHSRKEYEGTGAGLTIVRKIVEAHGGRIRLESRPGAGTTFYMTFAPGEEDQAQRESVAEPVIRPPHWPNHAQRSARAT